MNDFQILNNSSRPVKLAVYSFAGGSIFCTSHLLFPDEVYILIAGVVYVVLAFFINAIMLLVLFHKLIVTPANRLKTTEEIAVLLCNIPIAAIYLFIIINQNNLF